MTSYNERIYWNNHVESYGTAIRIKKVIARIAITILAISTPGTNWLLPFILPRIKDIIIRW